MSVDMQGLMSNFSKPSMFSTKVMIYMKKAFSFKGLKRKTVNELTSLFHLKEKQIHTHICTHFLPSPTENRG